MSSALVDDNGDDNEGVALFRQIQGEVGRVPMTLSKGKLFFLDKLSRG